MFTCRVLRGSAESLNLEWILTDGTPVQVRRDRLHRSSHLDVHHLAHQRHHGRRQSVNFKSIGGVKIRPGPTRTSRELHVSREESRGHHFDHGQSSN